MKSVVSEKGQVAIPKALRHKLGIEPGTVLDFEDNHGLLVARKLTEKTLYENGEAAQGFHVAWTWIPT